MKDLNDSNKTSNKKNHTEDVPDPQWRQDMAAAIDNPEKPKAQKFVGKVTEDWRSQVYNTDGIPNIPSDTMQAKQPSIHDVKTDSPGDVPDPQWRQDMAEAMAAPKQSNVERLESKREITEDWRSMFY